MPLIAPLVRQDRQPVTTTLDVRLVTLLEHYAELISSSPDHVFNQAPLVAFASDPEFKRWIARTHREDAGRIQELAGEQPRVEAAARLHRVGAATRSGASLLTGRTTRLLSTITASKTYQTDRRPGSESKAFGDLSNGQTIALAHHGVNPL